MIYNRGEEAYYIVMRKQRGSGYPVGRLGTSSRRTHKRKGQGKQNFGCHYDANLCRCEESLQGFIFSTPCHAVFAFLNPLLIGVIQVKFQGTNQIFFIDLIGIGLAPPALLGRLIFAAWIILPIMVARNFVQFICLWIYQRIMTLIFKILGFWYRFLDEMSVEEQAEYPVEIIIAN
ncbi:hypothetical protein POTOM_046391 [Populus tomentosa]|uniref:Uncharacterized protein n=1 Tax=Populus tomentosa TaxID=118781 RepID=A0A8X8CCM5_POPTO|nr:hypothetical protein POTOM_046391 [Populus tomentosa]